MKNTKAKSRVKLQKTLNGLTSLTILFIIYGCLGPYVNDNMSFVIALLNMIKLTSITLIMYVILTFTNHLVRK